MIQTVWCDRCRRSFSGLNKRHGICPWCLHHCGIDVIVCRCLRCERERLERDLTVVEPERRVDPAGEGI